jgi:hypothetical protein
MRPSTVRWFKKRGPFPHGPEPYGPPGVVEGPIELAPAPKGVGDLRGEARPLGIRQRGRIDVGLADEDQLVPAAMVVEGGGHQPGDADLLGVGRIELQQRAPVLEGGLRLVADDQSLEALHEQALAVGQVLGQPGGGADGRGGVGVAIAPLTAPLQDLRLLQVSLGEGGIERGGLVETLLGLLGAPASSADEPAHRLDVLAVGLDRLRGQPRGARGAGALRRRRRAQGAEQGHAQIVHGRQQLARHAPGDRRRALGASRGHVDHLGLDHEAVLDAQEGAGHETLGPELPGQAHRTVGRQRLVLVVSRCRQRRGQAVPRHDVQARRLSELRTDHLGQPVTQPAALRQRFLDEQRHHHQRAGLRGRGGRFFQAMAPAPTRPGEGHRHQDAGHRYGGASRAADRRRPAGTRLRAGEADLRSGRRRGIEMDQSNARPFDQSHGGQELVSPARSRLDVSGSPRVVAQRPADLDHALDEDVVGHERVGPELLHQLRLRHDPSRVAREVPEGLEWLGGQRDHALVFRQAARLRVQHERPEDEPRRRRRLGASPLPARATFVGRS